MYKSVAPEITRLTGLLRQLEPNSEEYRDTLTKRNDLITMSYRNLTASDRVFLARQQGRPLPQDYVQAIISDFCELHGDRTNADDPCIMGGIGRFCGVPVTVIATRKGKDLDESIAYRFGMPIPEGYRKVERLALQAQKFNRPIITFIDTPGAYPGIEAEARGQGEAIAKLLAIFSDLSVPIISVVTGEGGSGGALALSVCDVMIMLENSVYSILSPEGFASILWRDASLADKAAEIMGLTANDLYEFGVCDIVLDEPVGGAQQNPSYMYQSVMRAIQPEFARLRKMLPHTLKKARYKRLRSFGKVLEE